MSRIEDLLEPPASLEVCADCGHARRAHYGAGGEWSPCLVAGSLTRDRGWQPVGPTADGSPRAPSAAVCPCTRYVPKR